MDSKGKGSAFVVSSRKRWLPKKIVLTSCLFPYRVSGFATFTWNWLKYISQFENILKRILPVADLQEISMKPEEEYYNLNAKLKLTEISQKSLIQHASFLERCKNVQNINLIIITKIFS